ncbi:MAG: hypothetical protein IJP43_06305, partial [Oscillospiraceae bacterium]|nr:hypothetical protein [Oscillospiraceae bacterium]
MKTKRLFARITCILLLTLLSAPLFAVNSNALMQNAEDMNWARTADLQEVKNKLKDLQEYLLPLDRHDLYFYEVLNTSGGGSNQGNANGYTNRFSYNITTEVETGGGSHLPVTRTRVDLNLPELPHYDGHDRSVFYYCESYSNSWDHVSDYADVENSERITTIGGYPAKGYARVATYKGKTILYESYIYVNLQTLFPWIQEGAKGGIVLFHVKSSSSEPDSIAEAQRLTEIIKNWQPTISEPVVIAAETDPEVLKDLGIKKGGANVVVDTPAKEEAGEDSGTEIPAIIILGTLGAGAALAGAASGDGEGDKKKRSSFKMYINKIFGSSLKKGDQPQAVFARIAEVTPDGREIPRPDLTGQIRVWSFDDSLIVKDGGMVNGYKCAMVSVYDTEDQPPEGKVSFYFEGEGGSFTQNVIFNIAVPGIKFFQENLTLPAGILEEPEFLPFEVSEMGDKYEIELSYNGENYEIDLAECDDKNAHVHYAVF